MTVREIGNGIFEALRLATVKSGYFPDIEQYLSPKNTQGWLEAKEAILSSGHELIEVFNVGAYISRPRRKVNDIALDRVSSDISKRGTKSIPEYESNTDGKIEEPEMPSVKRFIRRMTAKNLYDIQFQLQYIAYSEEYAEIIERLIHQTIGAHAALYGYDDLGNKLDEYFVIICTGTFDTSGADFIERGYRFTVPAKDIEGPADEREVSGNVSISIDLEDLEGTNLLTVSVPTEVETEDPDPIVDPDFDPGNDPGDGFEPDLLPH